MIGARRASPLGRGLLLLAGLVSTGRLASLAWLAGPDLDAPAPPVTFTTSGSPSPFLLVVVDGLREDAVASTAPDVMPFWRALAADGASGIARTGEPTLTAACVRTLLTGRAPDLTVAARNFDAPVVRENLVQRLAERGLRVAHAGDATAYQLAAPWYRAADVLAVADRGPADQGATDEEALPFALARIDDGVDAATVHLTRPDHAGHAHGATLLGADGLPSPYARACRTTDDAIRTLVGTFRARHPDALVLVAADHGLTARGTHGGGEAAARRAPFVLAGPAVEPARGVELSQSALASSVAALLRVAPLPFADAAPVLSLTRLPTAERVAALSAYVDARLALAASSGAADLADAIGAGRARASTETALAALARLEEEARRVERASANARDPVRVAWALVLAGLLGLAAADPRGVSSATRARALLASALLALAAAVAIPSVRLGGAIVAGACASSVLLRDGRRASRGAVTALAAFVAVSIGAFALAPVLDAAGPGAVAGISVAIGLLVGVLAWTLADPRARVRAADLAMRSPGALLVGLGVGIGVIPSFRPLIDPFVSLTHVVAGAAVLAVALVTLRRRSGGSVPRSGVLATAAVALAWLAPRDLGAATSVLAVAACVSIAGAMLVVARFRAGARPTLVGAPASSMALALAALAAAVAFRLGGLSGAVAFRLVLAAALLAALLAVRARGDAALLVRLLAALALVLVLERRDDDAAVRFALLVGACFAASGARIGASRSSLVFAAGFLALVRLAAFHAAGFTETLSTIDTGAGVVPGAALPPGAAGGISWANAENAVLQALRVGLPWLPLLAAASRALERRRDAEGPGLRDLGADLVALLAVRGAALVLALATWWPQSWWVSAARAVYPFALADALLVLGTTALVSGAVRAGARRTAYPPIAGSSGVGLDGSAAPPAGGVLVEAASIRSG